MGKYKILHSVLISFFVINAYSQNLTSFGTSLPCEVNVYNNAGLIPNWQSNINATFLWGPETGNYLGTCSGTLVNVDIDQDNLGTYFTCANHCITEGPDVWDVNGNFIFYFNYQSKDANSGDVPLDAQDGSRYSWQSKIEQVGVYFDFVLFKMVTPPPPHFNLYYAGWKTNLLGGDLGNYPFFGISHPKADIKKASVADLAILNENLVAQGCEVITKIIDAIAGFFHIKISTEVICNYVEIPSIIVPAWTTGLIEDGSSGSGIFNNNTREMGVCSFGLYESCFANVGTGYFKFHLGYNVESIRNALNPNNNLGTNLFGIDGRRISCYHQLLNLHGNYYPAGDYQPENTILLASNTVITTSNSFPLTIYKDASFYFQAGQSITLNPGFMAVSGSNFTASIQPCSAQFRMKDEEAATYQSVASKSSSFPLIKFDPKKYLGDSINNSSASNSGYIKVYPNPNSGIITIEKGTAETSQILLHDITGKIIFRNFIYNSGPNTIDLVGIDNGVYVMEIRTVEHVENFKIIVAR